MTEESSVIQLFESAGILGAIRWAYESAASRVADTYSFADGHTPTWVGVSRYTYFVDRLDRVFGTGRFAPPAGSEEPVGRDVLHAELTQQDIDSMPDLEVGLVRRSDVNGSAGWVHEGWRWLLVSARPGKIDAIMWGQKSETKKRVARQRDTMPDQPSLFDELVEDEYELVQEQIAAAEKLDLETLIVAHAQDVDRDRRELVIGRARLNEGGGAAWTWRRSLRLEAPPEDKMTGTVPMGPQAPITPVVPDADVRLRPRFDDRRDAAGSGS